MNAPEKRENLFSIIGQYQADLAKLADLDLPPDAVMDTIEGMQGDIEQKIRAIIAFARQLDADAAAMQAEADRILKNVKTLENRADSLRTYAQIGLMQSGLTLPIRAPEFTINLAKLPPASEIVDEQAVPLKYKRVTIVAEWENFPNNGVDLDFIGSVLTVNGAKHVSTTFAPRRREILAALKEGQEVTGARLLPTAYRLSVR